MEKKEREKKRRSIEYEREEKIDQDDVILPTFDDSPPLLWLFFNFYYIRRVSSSNWYQHGCLKSSNLYSKVF